jgi:hypothetical protein
MMGEPINERHGTGRVRKDRVPLLERQMNAQRIVTRSLAAPDPAVRSS